MHTIIHFSRTSALLMLAAVACASSAQSRAESIVSFDAPGSLRTYTYGISAAGAVTGDYVDLNLHKTLGFMRTLDGQFTTFQAQAASADSPGALPSTRRGRSWEPTADTAVYSMIRP